jgi:hypothetical protein
VYIQINLNVYTTNSGIHSHNTRGKDDLFILPCNMSLCKINFSSIGIRMLNQLPQSIKEIPVLYKFKKTLRTYLLDHCFYSNFSCLWHILALITCKHIQVSQEECARLREGVPYGKVYRYNPKHLCPKLKGYGDNGQRSLKL